MSPTKEVIIIDEEHFIHNSEFLTPTFGCILAPSKNVLNKSTNMVSLSEVYLYMTDALPLAYADKLSRRSDF